MGETARHPLCHEIEPVSHKTHWPLVFVLEAPTTDCGSPASATRRGLPLFCVDVSLLMQAGDMYSMPTLTHSLENISMARAFSKLA